MTCQWLAASDGRQAHDYEDRLGAGVERRERIIDSSQDCRPVVVSLLRQHGLIIACQRGRSEMLLNVVEFPLLFVEYSFYTKIDCWGTGVVVWSEMQTICTWSSWCHRRCINSCFIKIQIGFNLFGASLPRLDWETGRWTGACLSLNTNLLCEDAVLVYSCEW